MITFSNGNTDFDVKFVLINDEADWDMNQQAIPDVDTQLSVDMIRTFPQYRSGVGDKPYNSIVKEIFLNPEHFPQLYRRVWEYGIGTFYVPCTVNFALQICEKNVRDSKKRVYDAEMKVKHDKTVMDYMIDLKSKGVK